MLHDILMFGVMSCDISTYGCVIGTVLNFQANTDDWQVGASQPSPTPSTICKNGQEVYMYIYMYVQIYTCLWGVSREPEAIINSLPNIIRCIADIIIYTPICHGLYGMLNIDEVYIQGYKICRYHDNTVCISIGRCLWISSVCYVLQVCDRALA